MWSVLTIGLPFIRAHAKLAQDDVTVGEIGQAAGREFAVFSNRTAIQRNSAAEMKYGTRLSQKFVVVSCSTSSAENPPSLSASCIGI